MKVSKSQVKNIIFLVIIALIFIPQTRQPIQIALHKGLALFAPSKVSKTKQQTLENYNWQLRDGNGLILNFQDIKGKVIFLNFWATWCSPCIAEMPSIQKLYENYEDKVEFVFVSNEEFSNVNQFLNKNNYSFKVYNSVANYPKFLDVTNIPRTFLIDKSGRIVIDKTGAANWNSDVVKETINNLLR